ncbi:MAG: S8 family serine peptidase [Woeseiaceae bacterium]|nr:S8 family serine peptidase [Woeseiaceae bacterium]
MNTHKYIALLLVGLITHWPATAPAGDTDAVADEWIVVMTDTRSSRRRGWSSGVGYAGSYQYDEDPKLKRLAAELARDFSLEVTRQWPVRSLNVHCVVVRIGDDLDATLEALREDSRVEWVQPLNTFEGLATLDGGNTSPVDPYRHLQSSLEMLNVAPVHRALSGAGVRIAVVDSGVEPDHPDIKHALAEQVDFVGRGDLSERHGTGIAGVLVAANHNGVGITGVAPGAHLHAYRACWELNGGTRCNSLTLSQALDRVVDARPHIVNLSLTGPKDPLLDKLVGRIVGAGTIVVVAHDEDAVGERFPTPRPGVVIVRDGSGVAETTGDTLFAPGGAVLTAQPGHSYDYMSGASMAAAHVSGVLALMLEADPAVNATDTLYALTESVRAAEGGASVDACAAVSVANFSCD